MPLLPFATREFISRDKASQRQTLNSGQNSFLCVSLGSNAECSLDHSQHNYEVRGLTGLVDLYVMTGNQTYLDAALGGWAMLRESWQHVGGSLAINEEVYFPPKSYCERSNTDCLGSLCML